MIRLNKILVYIVSGLFLCPTVLDLSFSSLTRGNFVETTPSWVSSEKNFTGAVAWGDFDADGDLDLAVGNYGPNYIYYNDNGIIPTKHSWISSDSRDTFSLVWVDFDNDGDLDLSAGNRYAKDAIYLNDNGRLLETPIWNSTEEFFTTSIKWGDIDSDGDLDMVAGHVDSNITIYGNNGINISQDPIWRSEESYWSNDIELGDINGDGNIDLISGNGEIWGGSKNVMFLNTGTGFPQRPNWNTQNPRRTSSIALGDVDRDGDLDLAMGTFNQGTNVFFNTNGNFSIKPDWSASDTSMRTFGIEFADMTGNGYLDLVLAIKGQNAIYKNTGGVFESYASWYSTDDIGSSSIGIGDINGDASLDLSIGNTLPNGEPNKIHLNNGTVISPDPLWTLNLTQKIQSVAWYDIDEDDDQDLAVGTSGKNIIYYNSGTSLSKSSGWLSADSSDTRAMTWGDLDGDGDFDLITGNYGSSNLAYRNNYGSLTSNAWWTSGKTSKTTSIALADLDLDDDLDLAVGNENGPNYIYLNTGLGLAVNPSWSSNDTSKTFGVAWGDLENDNNLDLAVANSGSGVEIYHNEGQKLENRTYWKSSYSNDTRSIVWADMNGDGFLDIVTGAYDAPTYIYYNQNGSFNKIPDWEHSAPIKKTTSIYIRDITGSGYLDIIEVNEGVNRIFINDRGTVRKVPAWASSTAEASFDASIGDVELDGDFDIAVANADGLIEIYENNYMGMPLLVNNPPKIKIVSPEGSTSSSLYSIAQPLKDKIAIKYVLYDPEGAMTWIKTEYSTDGGGTWHTPTKSTTGGDPITNLKATPAGQAYTFMWDSKADNVVSPHVIFRISVNFLHNGEGVVQRPFLSTNTGIFPVKSPKINPPLNLLVTNPTTNTLDLQWTERTGESIAGYQIFMNESYQGKRGPYLLQKVVGKISFTTISGLADGVTYYFKVRSFDSKGIKSIYSNLAYGTTITLNLPPLPIKKIPDIYMDEDMQYFNHLNLNDYFRDELLNSTDPELDNLNFTISPGEDINIWISPKEWLNIVPPPDYFGTEMFTVTANDTIFETSMNFNVTVASINDRPILNLSSGDTIYGVQNIPIDLVITGFDPADPHDKLTFIDNTTLFDIGAETGIVSFKPLPWDVGIHYVNISLVDSGTPKLQDWATLVIVINATVIPPDSIPPISWLVYPDTGTTVGTLRPILKWDGNDSDSDEIFFDVFLAPDKSLVYDLSIFASIISNTTNKTFLLPQDLTNGLTYYWTVIPSDKHVQGTCISGIWEFTIDVSQAIPEVTLISPSNHKIVNSEVVRLVWQVDYDGTEKINYFVYMDTHPIPTLLRSDKPNELYLDVFDIKDGETYYWTVTPMAGSKNNPVIGTCISGIWDFTVDFQFIQTFGVSLFTSSSITLNINDTKLHDATVVNEGNNVDTFIVSISSKTLAGSVSLQSDWISLTDIGSGYLELGPAQAVTISLVFSIHDSSKVGIHLVEISVVSLGAQYAELNVAKNTTITVNVLDVFGNGLIDHIPAGTHKNGTNPDYDINITDPSSNKKGDNRIRLNEYFNWTFLIFAILIAIMIVLGYTVFITRKTKKKFEVYRTAQQILESKEIDSVSPLVAGFLAVGKGDKKSKATKIGDVELSASEAATVKEAFIIGSGVYTQAEEELTLVDHPYSSAAAELDIGDRYTLPESFSYKPEPELLPKAQPLAYEPDHMEISSSKPYSAAAKTLPLASRAPSVFSSIPLASPLAKQIDKKKLPSTKPVTQGAYSPKHVLVPFAKPYSKAAKMQILDKKLQDGKISHALYNDLKEKYAALPRKPESKKAAYNPDYMPLSTEKPYHLAAKLLALEQKLRAGKISKRLYEEIKSEMESAS